MRVGVDKVFLAVSVKFSGEPCMAFCMLCERKLACIIPDGDIFLLDGF